MQTFVRVHFVVVHFEKSNDPNVGDEHGQAGQDELEHEQDEYVDALVDRIGPVLRAVDRVLSFHNYARHANTTTTTATALFWQAIPTVFGAFSNKIIN